jgi:LysR family hydrogen peroxide-inducible transcriptional activator
MTLNELRYIVAVARERHFGRAAEGCFVSQPTLSVAVKKLERELGVSLFERGHGDVTLTPAGEQVVAQAQRVLEEAGAIKEIARHGQDQLAAPLRLGAIYTVGPYLLPHLIPLLAERALHMQLVI